MLADDSHARRFFFLAWQPRNPGQAARCPRQDYYFFEFLKMDGTLPLRKNWFGFETKFRCFAPNLQGFVFEDMDMGRWSRVRILS